MDNRHISIQTEGKKALDLAMQLMWDNAPGGKATHYCDHPTYGFVLFWHGDEKELMGKDDWTKPAVEKIMAPVIKLPFPMDCKAATEMVWSWLQEQPKEKYREELDHDGSNGRGFKIYNEYWGHVGSSHYAILAVLPVWAWYGK